jgi:hypothetical protein
MLPGRMRSRSKRWHHMRIACIMRSRCKIFDNEGADVRNPACERHDPQRTKGVSMEASQNITVSRKNIAIRFIYALFFLLLFEIVKIIFQITVVSPCHPQLQYTGERIFEQACRVCIPAHAIRDSEREFTAVSVCLVSRDHGRSGIGGNVFLMAVTVQPREPSRLRGTQ